MARLRELLSPASAADFWALHDCKRYRDRCTALGIVQTNAFGLGVGSLDVGVADDRFLAPPSLRQSKNKKYPTVPYSQKVSGGSRGPAVFRTSDVLHIVVIGVV